MGAWDVQPGRLCSGHLPGEHAEAHAIWNIITLVKRGYSAHPEVIRWRGGLKALLRRHERTASEMIRRGYAHRSPLYERLATGRARQRKFVNSVSEQARILKAKGCGCKV